MSRLIAWLCAWAAKRCAHPSEHVTFDLTEGALSNELSGSMYPVLSWCRCCGSHRFQYGEGSASAWRSAQKLDLP